MITSGSPSSETASDARRLVPPEQPLTSLCWYSPSPSSRISLEAWVWRGVGWTYVSPAAQRRCPLGQASACLVLHAVRGDTPNPSIEVQTLPQRQQVEQRCATGGVVWWWGESSVHLRWTPPHDTHTS